MGKLSKNIKRTAAAAAVLLIAADLFLVSSPGLNWRKNRILRAYDELPERERRGSELANDFLALGSSREFRPEPENPWFAKFGERRARIPDEPSETDRRETEMYKAFCGYAFDGAIGEQYMLKALQTGTVDGLCSPDGASGWGPLHPRAPESYYRYIQIFARTHSTQMTRIEISNYFRLFFTWCLKCGPNHAVHPNFMKYWPRLRDMQERSIGP